MDLTQLEGIRIGIGIVGIQHKYWIYPNRPNATKGKWSATNIRFSQVIVYVYIWSSSKFHLVVIQL